MKKNPIEELADYILPIYKKYDSEDVEDPYWMFSNAGDEDDTFCYGCGEKRREELLGSHPDEAEDLESLDGGFPIDSDSCCHCQTCGKTLAFELTDEGIEYELDHFEEYGISVPIPPDDAYHVVKMLRLDCYTKSCEEILDDPDIVQRISKLVVQTVEKIRKELT